MSLLLYLLGSSTCTQAPYPHQPAPHQCRAHPPGHSTEVLCITAKPIPTKTHPPRAAWTQTHFPRPLPTMFLPSSIQKIPRNHFSQGRPEAQDLHQGEITAIINIFKAVPFPAPQGQKEPSTAGQKSLAVGQAGMEGMEGHRVPERCGRHSSEGVTTLLTLTALPGQG